jgi:hypothetical protein
MKMTRITIRSGNRSRSTSTLSSVLYIGLGLSLTLLMPFRSEAAKIHPLLDANELNHPILLDQNGQSIPFPSQQHPDPVVLAPGVTPSYLAYQIDSGHHLPKRFPTLNINAIPPKGQATTGPLHLDALVKTRLDAGLDHYGKLAVHTHQGTYLVERVASSFSNWNGTGGTTGSSTATATPTREWLASQASGAAATSSTSAAAAAAAQPGASSTPAQSSQPSQPQAQTLLHPVDTGASPLLKNIAHSFDSTWSKLAHLNGLTLDNLKTAIWISPPKSVAPQTQTQHSVHAAELLGEGTGTGVAQPAPIPEPSTLVFFGLVLGAFGVRRGARRWGTKCLVRDHR